jgi:hypothetical protein
MKGVISIVMLVCGTALLITQRIFDGNILGGPSYCLYMGIGLCLTGVVTGLIAVKEPESSARRQSIG